MKKVLIIAYKFPPMGGIGTRRWAKFAKYFAKAGYVVHVVTISWKREEHPNWQRDVKDQKNIHIHPIKSGYPSWLLSYSNNAFIALVQKVCNRLLKRTFFYIDTAQRWYRYLLPYAKELIEKEEIVNVIVTSPPHSIAYYVTYLKIDFPHIRLIQDFRDNWNDDIPYAYPQSLKFFWQKERSAYMEDFVVSHSDYIVNVTQDLTDRTRAKFKNHNDKFVTIYNGYDKEDLDALSFSKEQEDGKIKIIYAGGLGLGRIEAIKMLMDALLKMPKRERERFSFRIYTDFNPQRLESRYRTLLKEVVTFFPLISSKEILQKIAESDYALSINAPQYAYAFGTKVFDYMMLEKKIIHISEGGELYEVLQKEGGWVVRYVKEEIEHLLERMLQEGGVTNAVGYESFDLKRLFERYRELLV